MTDPSKDLFEQASSPMPERPVPVSPRYVGVPAPKLEPQREGPVRRREGERPSWNAANARLLKEQNELFANTLSALLEQARKQTRLLEEIRDQMKEGR